MLKFPGSWACAIFACAALCLATAERSLAIPRLQPPNQAVAILSGGAVWFDDGPVFLKPFGAGNLRRIHSPTPVLTREAESSTGAVAVGGGSGESAEADHHRFLIGVPPAALRSIPYPPLSESAKCENWEPGGAHVLAGEGLIVAGKCFSSAEGRYWQPLLLRSLRGGHWHLLRWVAGESEPILAAEGPLLAVGVQHLSVEQMRVSIINLRSDRVQAHFTLPDGKLSFASPSRLVLFSERESKAGQHRTLLYSTDGRRIAELGTFYEAPLVSHMHLITEEAHEGPPGEGEYLSVRNLAGDRSGTPRLVIGFHSPARRLEAFSFRWPVLAVVESEGSPRLPSEIHCYSGEYNPGTPSLRIFDLAHGKPAQPPPAVVHVQASEPLNCGPPPPLPPSRVLNSWTVSLRDDCPDLAESRESVKRHISRAQKALRLGDIAEQRGGHGGGCSVSNKC